MSDKWNARILGAACFGGGLGTFLFKDARPDGDWWAMALDLFFVALGIAMLWPRPSKGDKTP